MNFDRKVRFFNVDDVIIRLESNEDGTIGGFVEETGQPYPPAKAIVDGYEIDPETISPRGASRKDSK